MQWFWKLILLKYTFSKILKYKNKIMHIRIIFALILFHFHTWE